MANVTRAQSGKITRNADGLSWTIIILMMATGLSMAAVALMRHRNSVAP